MLKQCLLSHIICLQGQYRCCFMFSLFSLNTGYEISLRIENNFRRQPMCLLWVTVSEHCLKFQIISVICFQNVRLSQKVYFPLSWHTREASITLFIIISTWTGISATQYTLEDRWERQPKFPLLRLVKTPHRRLNMSSEELLKAGQHEDRFLDPHVTLCEASSPVPTGFWTSPLQPGCKNPLHTSQEVQVVAFVAELCSQD